MKKAYILRTCDSNLQSRRGFQWPEKGFIEAPDWNPKPECGGGLHGFLNGEGGGHLADWSEDAKWLVVEVDANKVVDLDGKVKFPKGNVIFSGGRKEATDLIASLVTDKAVIGRVVVSEKSENIMAGDKSTLTAGNHSTLTASNRSTLTAGYRSTLTAGDESTLTAGHWSTLTAGHNSVLAAGDRSILTWKIWDCECARYRLHTFYVGENGVLPNTPYVFEDGQIKPLDKN